MEGAAGQPRGFSEPGPFLSLALVGAWRPFVEPVFFRSLLALFGAWPSLRSEPGPRYVRNICFKDECQLHANMVETLCILFVSLNAC